MIDIVEIYNHGLFTEYVLSYLVNLGHSPTNHYNHLKKMYSLTSTVACHDLIGQHLRKHRFHGCLLLPEYGLSEEEYRILELSVVQVDNGRPATRLLESSVEDLKAVCILYHVSFNYEQQELLDVHEPLL